MLRSPARSAGEVQPFERVRGGLVLVPEGRRVFPKFTVADNLLIGAYQRANRGALDGDLAMLYELFPRLARQNLAANVVIQDLTPLL